MSRSVEEESLPWLLHLRCSVARSAGSCHCTEHLRLAEACWSVAPGPTFGLQSFGGSAVLHFSLGNMPSQGTWLKSACIPQKRLHSRLHCPSLPLSRVRVIGSSTLALCHLASGAADAYYQFGLHCWDLAAATVIIREAGGIVIDTSGELSCP